MLGLHGFRGIAVAAALALSSGVGSVLAYRALHPVETRIVYVPQAATSATTPPPPPPQTPVLDGAETKLPPTPEKPSLPKASRSTRDAAARSSLALERSLLDRARTELGHDNAEEALRLASEHERAFPAGILREEREALVIRALGNLGRRDEARARMVAFRAEYPQSFLAPALSAALAEP
jgi:hypothetical protein